MTATIPKGHKGNCTEYESGPEVSDTAVMALRETGEAFLVGLLEQANSVLYMRSMSQ